MADALRERFLGALPPDRRERFAAAADLSAALERCRQAAVAAHGLAIDDALLAESLAGAGAESLDEINAGDLYLAAACARGDAAALRRFESAFGGELDRAIAKSRNLGLSNLEFRQLVLDRLFVREGERPPRIASYRGQGTLKAWVRVMTSRFIVDLARRQDRATASDDELADRIGAAEDTELDYLRHVYGSSLDAAFEQAVASLSVRQRNLLRQRYLHEVSPDTLAKMYGVHRSTLFTWLDKSRAALLQHVRTGLAQRVPGDQLESVVGMLGSRLQLSVRRMLDSRLEPDSDPA